MLLLCTMEPGLQETCCGLCLRDDHVIVDHLTVGDLGDFSALLLAGGVAVGVAVLRFWRDKLD